MANITRFNPFEELFSDFNKGFFVRPFALPPETDVSIRIDVREDEKSFSVKEDCQLCHQEKR